ncbi:MAG: hypothetical protein GY719_43075 [bacterium]|nr:hypothetical protein [bacterium]
MNSAGSEAIAHGSIVILYLVHPNEKYWGVLESLTTPGITVRAINLSSFDDWLRSVARDLEPSLGLGTIFFPMSRVERMFLDEQVGEVESLSQNFERRTGKSVEEVLGLGSPAEEPAN